MKNQDELANEGSVSITNRPEENDSSIGTFVTGDEWITVPTRLVTVCFGNRTTV
jgi:hypothetical protein